MANRQRVKTQPFDCIQYFYSVVQEPRIRCLIRFRGRIDETALLAALDLSIGAVPLLAFTFDEARHTWRDAGFTASDILRIVNLKDRKDAERYLLSDFDHAREAQLRVFLLREQTCDTLILLINHMVTDGVGFKQYLYLLSDLYGKCESGAGVGCSVVPHGKRNLHQLLKNLPFREKMRILRLKPDLRLPDPAMRLPLAGNDGNPMIVKETLDEAMFDAVKRYAKARRASVNDLFLTSYMRALRGATGCGTINMSCPVDLRRYAPGQECGICNLTGNLICEAEIARDEAFSDTLKKVSVQMTEQKESGLSLKGAMQFHMMYHLLPYKMAHALFLKCAPMPVLCYSNLGVLDHAQLRFGSHTIDEAFMSTAIRRPPYYQLSIVTYRNRCIFTSSLFGTEADRNQAEGFLSKVVNELMEGISNAPGGSEK